MALIAVVVLTIFVSAQSAFGWGLVTHVELAESVLTQASILALAIGGLLSRNKRDFILGNLLADVIIGKKLSRRRKRCHDWIAGWRLLENSHDDRTKAFAYGFITHLAADTVAHNDFVPRQIIRSGSTITLGHLYWELMADQMTESADRKTIRRLLKQPPDFHEQFLEDHLYPEMRWYGLNRGVFTRINRLAHSSKFNLAMKVCHELSLFPLRDKDINHYKLEALGRMVDILTHGKKSHLLKEDPNGSKALLEIHENRRRKKV
ncbi:MAG: zinc dependent phospholipase C family protein [Phycisphaerae bacterium]